MRIQKNGKTIEYNRIEYIRIHYYNRIEYIRIHYLPENNKGDRVQWYKHPKSCIISPFVLPDNLIVLLGI